jgi:hypothetical protein
VLQGGGNGQLVGRGEEKLRWGHLRKGAACCQGRLGGREEVDVHCGVQSLQITNNCQELLMMRCACYDQGTSTSQHNTL